MSIKLKSQNLEEKILFKISAKLRLSWELTKITLVRPSTRIE